MKIAVLVSGEPRYSSLAGEIFRKNAIEHEYDVFIHSWDHVTLGNKSMNFDSWRAKKIRVHSENRMLDPIFNKISQEVFLGASKEKFYEFFGQILSFYYSFDLCREHLNDYDLCIKIRHDSILHNIDYNINKLIKFDKIVNNTPYWRPNLHEPEPAIFVESINYYQGLPVIHDLTLFGTPKSFIQYASDLPQKIVDMSRDFRHQGFFFIHHLLWYLIGEIQQINILPMTIGSATLYDAPHFKSFLLRPGIENLKDLTMESLFQNYLSFKK